MDPLRPGEDRPRRVARLAVALLCEEVRFVDAARLYVNWGSSDEKLGAAKVMLRTALERLIEHWKIEPQASRMRSYLPAKSRPAFAIESETLE
jgi:hypothetical protein